MPCADCRTSNPVTRLRYHGRMRTCMCLLLAAPLALAAGHAQRGKYLVNEVAHCGDCHTPLGPGGLDHQKWLKGSVLTFQPIQALKQWRPTAPDITSTGRVWQTWGEAAFTKFLETGVDPSGHPADPPMPAYKLRPDDAADMVAYLKTLK